MSTVNIGSMPMNLKRRSVPVRKQAQVALVVLVAVRVQVMVRMVTDLIGIRPMDRNFPGMVVASPISLNLCSYWYSSDGEGFSGGDAGGFSDFFESMFGNRGRGSSNAGFRGQDYHADLNLSLRDAAQTHKQVLTVNGKNVRITIPAGVANGQVIKLKGYGVNGGPAGDLYITFVIADDPVFKRLGDDLYVDVPIDLYTAILGGDQLVDTLDGKVKLKVKPETQNGTKARLKGKGFPVYKKEGQFGDLIVTYSVKLPTNLTEAQKELFRKLQSMN